MKTCDRCEMMRAALEEISKRAAGLAASLEFVRKELYPTGTQLALPAVTAAAPAVGTLKAGDVVTVEGDSKTYRVKSKRKHFAKRCGSLPDFEFYRRLDAARVKSGLQFADVGMVIGKSESAVSNYFYGENRMRKEDLKELCSRLGLYFPAMVKMGLEAGAVR